MPIDIATFCIYVAGSAGFVGGVVMAYRWRMPTDPAPAVEPELPVEETPDSAPVEPNLPSEGDEGADRVGGVRPRGPQDHIPVVPDSPPPSDEGEWGGLL